MIGLSMFEEGERAEAMRNAGAVNYLTKSGPSEALLVAIRACGGRKMSDERQTSDRAAPLGR